MKFKEYITESSKDDYTGIFIGRMQGLTLGHTKVIDIMARTHPHSYVVLVKGEKSSGNKTLNPLPYEIQEKMIKKVLPDNVELITAKSANLEDILPGMDGKSFAVYAGPDRLQAYRKYATYVLKQGYNVKVIDTGQMIPRDDAISGTKLRQALKNDDIESFKKIAPKEIWDMFDELREFLR